MTESQTHGRHGRRGFFVRLIQIVQGLMGATLAIVLGRTILGPSFAEHSESWLPAGSLSDLPDHEPVAVTLRVSRPDGPTEVVDRRVVYLVRVGPREVRALNSTCTHLGCRTRYNADSRRIECPCHGGVYDTDGQVVAGPPPEPLASMATRLDGNQVLVRV